MSEQSRNTHQRLINTDQTTEWKNRLPSAAKQRQQIASGDNPRFVQSTNRPEAAKRRQRVTGVANSGHAGFIF